MTLKIMGRTGEKYQLTEKVAEFHEGELRGWPRFVEDYSFLQGTDEDEVLRTLNGHRYYAAEMDEDRGEEDQVGWFPDPDWEPENPEYRSDGMAE